MSLWHPTRTPLPKFERVYDGILAGGSNFTPSSAGLFVAFSSTNADNIYWEAYSSDQAKWVPTHITTYKSQALVIGDGSNLRLHNATATDYAVVVLRLKWE